MKRWQEFTGQTAMLEGDWPQFYADIRRQRLAEACLDDGQALAYEPIRSYAARSKRWRASASPKPRLPAMVEHRSKDAEQTLPPRTRPRPCQGQRQGRREPVPQGHWRRPESVTAAIFWLKTQSTLEGNLGAPA